MCFLTLSVTWASNASQTSRLLLLPGHLSSNAKLSRSMFSFLHRPSNLSLEQRLQLCACWQPSGEFFFRRLPSVSVCFRRFNHVSDNLKRITVLFAKIDNVAVESHNFLLIVNWKLLGKSCLCRRDKPFRFMKRWHQQLPALNCPCGIPYFSFFAMSRAFSLTSDGKMARPLFRFSVIHSRRSTSSSGHAAFLPRFAHFN